MTLTLKVTMLRYQRSTVRRAGGSLCTANRTGSDTGSAMRAYQVCVSKLPVACTEPTIAQDYSHGVRTRTIGRNA
jgi:hypothetical protein